MIAFFNFAVSLHETGGLDEEGGGGEVTGSAELGLTRVLLLPKFKLYDWQ